MSQISVIVPVYNVESYLPRCLDSILAQTLQDLEIILVDDGSTDQSGRICEMYAARNGHIQVIHQENRGASAARNTGLKKISGDWISFVDSDDWLDPKFYETLLEVAKEYKADIACCGFSCANRNITRKEPIVVFEGREIFYQLLEREYGAASLCNKIFWANLKDHLYNREDIQLNEDFIVGYEVCQYAKRMVSVGKALYHYTTREAGCVRGYTPEDNHLAVELAVERAEQVKGDEKAYNLCLRHCVTMRLREINQMIKYSNAQKRFRQMREETLADYQKMSDHHALNSWEQCMVRLLQYAAPLYPAFVKLKFILKKR